ATCKDQVVELVQNLQKVSLQKIIIASRLTAADLLTGKVTAKTFKVEEFDHESDKQCIANYWNLDISNLRHVPSEFLSNPLYLNMLKYIAENETNLEVVNAWNLYETVIKLKMEDYCRRIEPYIPDDNEARSILLKHQELALKVLFGTNEVTKKFEEAQSNRSNFVRLGLIIRYDNENPVFFHQTFVEFFVTKWLIENVDKDDAKYIYELILDTRETHILNIHSETLPLHKALLDKDYNKVLRLCKKNKRCLLEMDGLGRSVLHLAVVFEDPVLFSYYTLNDLIRCMLTEGYDIYTRDKIMKWTWIDYIQRYNRVEKLLETRSFLASQAFMNYCAIHVKSLNDLLERKNFFDCYDAAIYYTSISLIRTLLSWKYGEDRTFLEFHDMCLHSPTSMSRKHLDIKLPDENLNGTHLVCIYGNEEAVKTSIGSGVDFNKMDKFNCTPLHYSVMATQNKQIIGLLIEKYGILNLYADLHKDTTIFHMSIATANVNVTKMLLEGINQRGPNSPSLNAMDILMKSRFDSPYPDSWDPIFSLVFECYRQRSLLDLAVECGSVGVTKTLLEYDPDVRFLARPLNHYVDEPLITAVKSQQMEIIELLLQRGANPNFNNDCPFPILVIAISTGNENIVRMLLNHNADINAIYKSSTPLIHAVTKSTRAIVELLLRNGADVNLVDRSGRTPLMHAIKNKINKDILQLLLNFNADVNFENRDGKTPLYTAIKDKTFEIIESLLQNGASVNDMDTSGWTLLIDAVHREDDDFVQMLLTLHADVNIKGEDGVAPLCVALKTQNADIVQILLEKGADVNCFDRCGVSPLMAAVETGNTGLAKILLENEANVNLKNECGVTALYAAAFKRDVAMIELLVERGADSNIMTMGGDIFRNAKRTGNPEIVAWLLKNRPTTTNNSSESHAVVIIDRVAENWAGINLEDELRTLDPGHCDLVKPHSEIDTEDKLCLNQLNKISGSLLCTAMRKGNHSIITAMLLNRGYAVNKPDRDGFTPLMVAICNGDEQIMGWLLRSGADVNFEANDSGLTALYIAALIGDLRMVNKLLDYGANKNMNTSDDVFESCMKLAQLYSLKPSTYCTFENKNRVEDVIEKEAQKIATKEAKRITIIK
ncbi:hypothetical protein Trydic_g3745, partial [Trypoxylus dichotomus]